VKLLVDECLSPGYVRQLIERGLHDAIHPRYVGLAGVRDDQIVAKAFAEDRIIITANGRDYKRLLARMEVHPGVIIVEVLGRDAMWRQILLALDFIELQPSPNDYMVNRVVEVSTAEGVRPYVLSDGNP